MNATKLTIRRTKQRSWTSKPLKTEKNNKNDNHIERVQIQHVNTTTVPERILGIMTRKINIRGNSLQYGSSPNTRLCALRNHGTKPVQQSTLYRFGGSLQSVQALTTLMERVLSRDLHPTLQKQTERHKSVSLSTLRDNDKLSSDSTSCARASRASTRLLRLRIASCLENFALLQTKSNDPKRIHAHY